MLAADQDRVVVVLVRARNPSNIGAAARALHDLGFTQLRIANEFPVPFAAAKSAVDASAVLESAREFVDVADAIADCTYVFGTTAVGERVLEHPLHLLPQAATMIRTQLASDPRVKVALLFGSEKTGLSNAELSHCHALLTIPMNTRNAERHLSMNLGQAVAVCLYAIHSVPHSSQLHRDEWAATEARASSDELERITTLLREVLAASGYTRRHPANVREEVLRRMVRRMSLNAPDAPVWTGILRQLRHALAGRIAEEAAETSGDAHSSHEES